MASVSNGKDAFDTRRELMAAGRSWSIHDLTRLDSEHLPYSLKILLESLLRAQAHEQVQALLGWSADATPDAAVDLYPGRLFLHDTNGVPTLVDLAGMRDAVADLGLDPALVNPMIPAQLVADHSVIAEAFARPDARQLNVQIEYRRNRERYRFLKWGQAALPDFVVVPPGTGIMHQVNIEYLAQVVVDAGEWAYPDVCLGTDSHTTMVNGLGVLGWGIGGIEGEAVLLGQPLSLPLPPVVGFRLEGELPPGSTSTDLVLTVTQMLRRHGVVGKFVEFVGPGVSGLTVADRATIANMGPEYGSTAAMFAIDDETLRYLRMTGRSAGHVDLVERYAKEQGLWFEPDSPVRYSENITLDLSTVEASLAGPRRPQDRVALSSSQNAFATEVGGQRHRSTIVLNQEEHEIEDGAVAIAAITSCTNTSNPSVMVAAGLLARNAVQRGLSSKPWVKTTLSPGSRVVMDYYAAAGLTGDLEKLGFHLTGFGCMTCIGASGPLIPEVTAAAHEGVRVVSVLSGNRNFEGRINPDVPLNYLASPPLVVAYALAGTMDRDLTTEPLGTGSDGEPVYLRDIWPTEAEVQQVIGASLDADMFTDAYASVFDGGAEWQALPAEASTTFDWDPDSSYVRRPPHLDGFTEQPRPVGDIHGARVLVKLGDSVTTDHISPAGAIPTSTVAGRYLAGLGNKPSEFNTYASRRGNHEVMVRGTFANVRLRNELVAPTVGGVTKCFARDGEVLPVYEAALAYQAQGTPLVVLAGKEYGSGSSRDWAAKGPALLGVRAVLAQSFERIHRSNLIGMGILPLEFRPGQNAQTLGLSGEEEFDVLGLEPLGRGVRPEHVTVRAGSHTFEMIVRLDTPREVDYYRQGGIMPYVLRSMLARQ
ncbi:aconitate hydratase [Kineosporia sp. NBRC 101677]|uniref:aconitate hydratase AcnA n=1 Tax=Kineosporia sp. NBRC 101677 TaxID=3032197 RepID=UPI00249FE0B9|nr:aconitate hydratase AcnA [Kineosporia sp. NBRC 101677]GLY17082.1 aconitate hydratase [Kineosporia sp. NBRC 101677]